MKEQLVKDYLWAKKYPIAYYEVDLKQVLKPSSLLNLLQDMATINAEMHGFGYSYTFARNYGWFLIKYHMEFDEYPEALNEVLITTEPRGYSKIVAHRDFEIMTPDEAKRLGRAASSWMLIDLNTKRPLLPGKIFDYMPVFEKRDSDMEYGKLSSPEKVDFEKTFEIRYDEIDVNGHVNNANYIAWAFDVLPYDFRINSKIKTLDIVYKKEITYGNSVLSQVQIDAETNTTTHVLKNAENGEELCFLSAEWV